MTEFYIVMILLVALSLSVAITSVLITISYKKQLEATKKQYHELEDKFERFLLEEE